MIALIPLNWLNTASSEPTSSARPYPPLNSSDHRPSSCCKAAWMSRSSRSALAAPPMRSRIRRASVGRPAFISHRGFSGSTAMNPPNNSDGSASEANIQRQPVVTFQPGSPIRWICRPKNTARIPTTMASWYNDTSRPRIRSGAISAM